MAICPFRKFKKEGLARAKTQLEAIRSLFLEELSDVDGGPPNNAAPGSEAFGKGKLHIRAAAAPHVDGDFNQGAKFLMMAIDMFRNEKSHTSDARIDDPTRALHYLNLSSLAMALLEDAEVRN